MLFEIINFFTTSSMFFNFSLSSRDNKNNIKNIVVVLM